MKIEVHPLTHNPTAAWAELSKTQKLYKINVCTPTTQVADDKVRITSFIMNSLIDFMPYSLDSVNTIYERYLSNIHPFFNCFRL